MKHRLHVILAACLLVCHQLSAQVNYTANNTVPAYTGKFMYGTNGGWYGNSWDDKALADIAAGNPAKNVKGVGSKTFRPALPEEFLESWSYDIRIAEFTHYATLGVKDNTVFLNTASPAHKDNTKYNGCGDESVLWKNMYEPIWDNGANGTPVNENNYFALYVYKTVIRYKGWVKFWEIINEPDYDNAGNGWKKKGETGNWWDNNPPPCDLPNMKAPIFHYVRLLRIAYEVVKTVDPTAYVTTGGLGYISFLDAILRNTDNPNNGTVSSEFPLKGGAYFDVLSFHSYPMFNLATWSDANGGGWVFKRHSDAAVSEYVKLKNDFYNVLASYGYNGSTYPKKLFICTENNIPKKAFGDQIGSEDAQKNYIIKTLVASQKNEIRQYYTFVLGDSKTLAEATDAFQTMGLYQKLEGAGPLANGGAYKQQYNKEGIAFKTTSDLLRGSVYDAARTTAMALPATIDGAAFKDDKGKFTYVLWAKTTQDKNENPTATYSFPAGLNLAGRMHKKEWDFTESNNTATISSQAIALSGTPIFLTEETATVPLPEKPQEPNEVDPGRDLALSIYPNPAPGMAYIRFTLKAPTSVRLSLYTVDGKFIGMAIPNVTYQKGTHNVPLDLTRTLSSGVYVCRFEADIILRVEKLVIGR